MVLALVLSAIAAAGVLNTMLLNTREQIRDTAILKALGMTPRQVVGMVATSAAALGLTGAMAGLPAGVAVYRSLLGTIAARFAGDVLPADLFSPKPAWSGPGRSGRGVTGPGGSSDPSPLERQSARGGGAADGMSKPAPTPRRIRCTSPLRSRTTSALPSSRA